MPIVETTIDMDAGNTESPTQYTQGTMTGVELRFENSAQSADVVLEVQIKDGTWSERFRIPDVGADNWYIPARLPLLNGGSTGIGEMLLSLLASWRWKVEDSGNGVSQGLIRVFTEIEQ